MKLSFQKMNGCGNDFLFLDLMRESEMFNMRPHEVAYLCDRNFGIGADGLVLLGRSFVGNAKWIFYNCDGQEAEMCGNAARCAIRLLGDRYFPDERLLSLETKAGLIKGRRLEGDQVEITLSTEPVKRFEYQEKVLRVGEQAVTLYTVNTGVPHAVIEVKDIRTAPIEKYGKLFVRHPAFMPEGTNVTFYQVHIGQKILSTTFERGVEKETLACGTGAAAAAIVYSELYMQPLPIQVTVPGGELEVTLSGEARRLLLRGPAEYGFEVSIDELPAEFTPKLPFSYRAPTAAEGTVTP